MTNSAAASPKRGSWLRRFAWLAAFAVFILVAGYFVVTSGAFFKSFILPKVGQAMNATVAVSDASISPFSAVTLKGLTVRTTGDQPAVTVDEVRLRYSLKAILGGTLQVDEVSLINPKVSVILNADGTSNLDPMTKRPAETKPPTGPESKQTPLVSIGKVAVSNGQVQVVQKQRDGSEHRLNLDPFNFALTDIKNGQTAHLVITGDSKWYSGTATSNSSVGSTLKLDLNLGLTPELLLAFAKGGMTVEVGSATGDFAQLAGFRSVVDCDVTPTEFKQLSWRAFNAARLLAEMTVTGQFDLTKKEGALDMALSGLNFVDWQAFAPGLEPVGVLSAKGKLTARDGGRAMAFDWQTSLRDFGAKLGSNRLAQLGVSLTARGQVTNFNRVQLERAEVALTHQAQPAGTLSASGWAGTDPQSADLQVGADLDLARLIQILPQPDLQLSAGQIRLLNGRLQQEGSRQSLAGLVLVTNLTGRVSGFDLQQFAVGAGYDLSATDGKVIDLRKLELLLAETVRTKSNRVELSGRVDLTRTNSIEGDLKLSADVLDLTPYYDLVDKSKPAAEQGSTASPASTNAPVEPAPLQLPVKQFIVAGKIGRFWLREVEATQVLTTIKIESNRVTIRPLSLAMNGAPFTADVDLDLSPPGWRYAVRGNAAGLPIAPLADSFLPDYRGRAKGDLWADLKVDGAGVTGPNLKKNLLGNLSLSFTNADIQIVGPRLKSFLTPIAMGLNAPGLLSSPLNWVGFGASLGSGKMGLSQLTLVSPAFAAATHGEVTLGDQLKDTRLGNWPMAFQLERSLAERLKLAPKETPTNVALVALPQFVTVAGTANDPKPKLDLQALAGAALLKYADKIPGLNEQTSGLLKGAAGLLSGSGSKAGDTNSSAANTNAPLGGLQDLFKRRPKP